MFGYLKNTNGFEPKIYLMYGWHRCTLCEQNIEFSRLFFLGFLKFSMQIWIWLHPHNIKNDSETLTIFFQPFRYLITDLIDWLFRRFLIILFAIYLRCMNVIEWNTFLKSRFLRFVLGNLAKIHIPVSTFYSSRTETYFLAIKIHIHIHNSLVLQS